VRYLSGQIDRARWRNTLVYRVTPDLQAGVEYNPLADDVNPLANWRVVREGPRRPAVTLGTSSDRIGTPKGLAYYATVSKAVPLGSGGWLSPYVGLLWSEHDERLRLPAGIGIPLGRGISLLPTYDGHAFHVMGSYAWERYTLTGILVRGRDPGVALTVGF
jgi:hypothetical protein